MRRAERLFRIIQLFRRRRRAMTAKDVARELGVSPRTVYRDVAHLLDSGVPIRGEAGVGYVLERSYDLPPLMLDDEEVEALVFGARMVRSWADPDLAAAAGSLLDKIDTVLPERLRRRIETSSLYAFDFRSLPELRKTLGRLRRAISKQQRIRFAYTDRKERSTERVVRPLGLFYWGVTWTLAAWCELREDFRNFRLDRMLRLDVLEETFAHQQGRTLEDLFRRYEEGE